MSETTHYRWNAESLWEQLAPLLPGLSIEVVSRTDSTNTQLINRAREQAGDPDAPVTRPGHLDVLREGRATPHGRRAGDMEPCLLVAEHQTRGRGRMGRGWEARPGAGLTFSLALTLEPLEWSGLSLAVGVALAEALEQAQPRDDGRAHGPDVPPRIGMKWPNDLWLIDPAAPGGGRKLAGILIETVSVGRGRMCVLGIGVNVLPQVLDGLPAGFACLQELAPTMTPPAALAAVAVPLVRALKRFEREGFLPLIAAYARRDLLAGRTVATTQTDCPEGVAEGVDERGALRVRVRGGETGDNEVVRRIVSGEVSVRPVGKAA